MKQFEKKYAIGYFKNQLIYTLIITFIFLAMNLHTSFGLAPAAPGSNGGGSHNQNYPPRGDINPVDYDDGYQFGLRNGGILADRIKKSTVDRLGCSSRSLAEFENALLKVTRNVNLPAQSSSNKYFTIGFYEGYLKALKSELRRTRQECQEVRYHSGVFPGEFYGNAVCNLVQINVDWVYDLQLDSLFEDWAAGNQEVIKECHSSFSLTLENCHQGLSQSRSVSALIGNSCL